MQADSFTVARKTMASGALVNSAPGFSLGTSKDFPTTVDSRWAGGVPLLQSEVQQRQWMPDGRDAFISWLRAEFAAANAIIDALCHHLQLTSKPAEYDFVLGCIQQRRSNWNAVLHMQQYFSIAEVIFALQQVVLRKQQMQNFDRSNLYLSQASVVPDERNVIPKANVLKATSRGCASITLNPSTQNSVKNSVESQRDQLRDEESKKENRLGCQPTNEHESNVNRQEKSNESEITSVSIEAQDSSGGTYMEVTDSLLETELPKASDMLGPLGRHECEGGANGNSLVKEDFGNGDKIPQSLGRLEGAVAFGTDTTDAMEGKNESSVAGQADVSRVNFTDKEITPLQQIVPTSNPRKQTGSLSRRSTSGENHFSKSEEESLKTTKNFSYFEQIDGKMINVVEGMELYENFLNKTKSSQLLSSLYELECVTRKGKLGGYRFVTSKKWTKAKGRKNIQFGSLEYAEDDQRYHINSDDAIEPMPTLLQETIDNLVHQNIVVASKRPDCCNLIVLEEGEYLSPHSMQYDLEKPLYILTLACDCIAILGRTLKMDSPGEFVSSFKITLPVGSVLVLQGNSSCIARSAISSSPVKRVLLQFGKLKSKKVPRVVLQASGAPSSGHSSVTSPFPNPTLSTNQIGIFKSSGQIMPPATVIPRSYTSVSVPPVSRPPPPHATTQFPQPIISSPTVQAGTFPSMTITNPAWTAVPGPVRVHATGTGVFLPSSGVSSTGVQPINGPVSAQIRQVFMPVPPLQKTTSSPAVFSSLEIPESLVSSRPSKSKARANSSSDGTAENSGRSLGKKDFGKGSADGKLRSDAANARPGDMKQQAGSDGHSGPANASRMED